MNLNLSKWVRVLHRILGTLLSVFFLMWFLTGLVMLYHRFPRVYDSDRVEHLEILGASDTLPTIGQLIERVGGKPVRSLRMERYLGQTYFNIQTSDSLYVLPAREGEVLHSIRERDFIDKVVRTWCEAPILRIDTLTKLDQWIPFGSMKADLPVYRYYFHDAEQHQLYQSSRTGKVLQFTTRSECIWAWLGAIPHWIYFYQLRQDVDLWSDVVIGLSGTGCIMVLAGLWLGILRWRQHRRKHKEGITPYKKRWYRWHHLAGLLFGLFALTFVFSGMMSMMPLPRWITHSHLQGSPSRYMQADAPQPDAYALDYRLVVRNYPEAILLQWSNFRNHPYYVVQTSDDAYYIDGNKTTPQLLDISKEEFVEAVSDFYRTDSATQALDIPLQVELLDHFETHYRVRSVIETEKLLPVWKITASDRDKSVFYMNPRNAAVRYVDTTSRLNYWAYTALHRMRIGFLNDNSPLRKALIWVLMLGGAVVSTTGIVLGFHSLRRLKKKKL